MATNTYVALKTTTLTSTAASVTLDLTGISGYTDVILVANVSMSSPSGIAYIVGQVGNGTIDTGSNYSSTVLVGDGSSAYSYRTSNVNYCQYDTYMTGTNQSILTMHFMNYSNTTTNKTFIGRTSNGSKNASAIVNMWRSTSAINQIKLYDYTGNSFAIGSTFTLYGIAADSGSYTTKATGGTVTTDQFWVYHTFTSSGTFTPTANILADVLVVAGGGGSTTGIAGGGTGGGGAGGLIGFTNQALTPTAYTVTVGAGGTDSNGSNSVFGSLTAAVGGGRGGAADTIGAVGGSGGGTGFRTPAGPAAGTTGQGNAGGNTSGSYPNFNSGGGGGAGAAGGTGGTNGGAGGVGSNAYSTWASATGTGHSGYYAGGGGGMIWYTSGSPGAGGTGGGGTGAATSTSSGSNGLANTGGGAGGSAQTATSGGSGIVIVRYAK